MGVYVGERSIQGAQALWNSLPAVYHQCAVAYSDFWNAYGAVLPSKRHKAVGKETGKTNDAHSAGWVSKVGNIFGKGHQRSEVF